MTRPIPLRTRRRPGASAALGAALLTAMLASGCDRDDPRSLGERLDDAVGESREQARQTQREAGTAMDQASSTLDDAAITARINAALAGDPQLSALGINVDTRQGQVSLNGTAPDEASRERATALARAVEGVQSVDNRLQVAPPR